MPHYRVYNNPGQILSQVPEDIKQSLSTANKTVADLNKESAGCKKSKASKGCKTKTGTKTTKVNNSKGSKITTLDELRMKYSK